VELGKVKVLPDTKIQENGLVIMKRGKGFLQTVNQFHCMALVLSKVHEIQERMHGFDDA